MYSVIFCNLSVYMGAEMKPSLVAIGIILTSLFSACTPPPVITPERTQTQPVTPTPSQTPTVAPSEKPTIAPTIEPTAGPSIVRPESGIKTVIQYTQEQLDAIQSGKFQEGEDIMSGWLDFWLSGRPEPGEDLNFKTLPLTYIYLFDVDTLDNVIVALESPDYPNTIILPPIDFTKSKGLDVHFIKSLPYEKDGHSVPAHLMPTLLTDYANEESVESGKMQKRFLDTTFTNIDGSPARINQEGKVIAKIGVKPETQEARWVRAELCTDYSNPENYTVVTLDEIRSGQILYDEEIFAEPFPEDVVFPARFELNVNKIDGNVFGYDANDEPTTKFYRNVFFYMLDETFQYGDQTWYFPIVSQQYLNKDGSWSFIKRDRGGWNKKDPEKYVSKVAPDMTMLPTFYMPDKAFPQSFWEYYRKINNDDTFLSLGGNLEKLYKEYTLTGFIPDKLTRYIIPGYSYVKVR